LLEDVEAAPVPQPTTSPHAIRTAPTGRSFFENPFCDKTIPPFHSLHVKLVLEWVDSEHFG
jgi:hypothetical protein